MLCGVLSNQSGQRYINPALSLEGYAREEFIEDLRYLNDLPHISYPKEECYVDRYKAKTITMWGT